MGDLRVVYSASICPVMSVVVVSFCFLNPDKFLEKSLGSVIGSEKSGSAGIFDFRFLKMPYLLYFFHHQGNEEVFFLVLTSCFSLHVEQVAQERRLDFL